MLLNPQRGFFGGLRAVLPSLGALGMCGSIREDVLKTQCHASESQMFITWLLPYKSSQQRRDPAQGVSIPAGARLLAGRAVLSWDADRADVWSAGGARFESAAVLTIVPPNQTPQDDFESRGTGAEGSCVPQGESCRGGSAGCQSCAAQVVTTPCVLPGSCPRVSLASHPSL